MLLHPHIIHAINRCKSIAHVSRLCQAHLADYGFRHVAYLSTRSVLDSPEDWTVSTTYPREWQSRYVTRSYATVDPVLKACNRAMTPIDWSQVSMTSREERVVVGEAADYGIGATGISVPLYSPDGRFGLMSFTADQQTDDWGSHSSTMASLTLLAMHCHARISHLEHPLTGRNRLTPRELECLTLCASGKSLVETAREMRISARTIRFHLENVRMKLRTQSTIQTVSKAIALGLISMK